MQNVLFICTHNSSRSQMAEAFLNKFFSDKYKGFSAGTVRAHINPNSITVMKELGIDISKQHSKSIKELPDNLSFDYVVTLCDKANESCPIFPGNVTRVHKDFTDPSSFTGDQEEILTKFRMVRDNIAKWVKSYFSRKN